jgi:hypothetical protein
MTKQYRGQNPFLKALHEDPNTLKRYNFSWYVNDERVSHAQVYAGSLNFRCKDLPKEKNERIMKILKQIQKKYRLPSTEVINFAIRRVQR